MYRIFKNFKIPVTLSNLPEALSSLTPTTLKSLPKSQQLIPPGFCLITQQSSQTLRRQIKFLDFRQAFAFFNLINSTFVRYNYYPKIFNVYNKLVIDFTDETLKEPTVKDLFLARMLFELENNPVHAVERTLQEFNEVGK